jgi:hypothetical protein
VVFTDGDSSLLGRDNVSLSVHFQHSAGPWRLHLEGLAVQDESSTLNTEALKSLTMSATTHTMTQHHIWHYTPEAHNCDT